jgi:hypothetical protein
VRALRRALDFRSTRSRVDPLDIFRPVVAEDLTEVEVTLLDLGGDLEQLFGDSLELIDKATGDPGGPSGDAVLGLRICYRASYDFDTDTGDHWVDYPARSDAVAEVFRKVPRQEREALPVLFLEDLAPLQVRAEGAFRSYMEDLDAPLLESSLTDLETGVATATDAFAASSLVDRALQDVLSSGVTDLLGKSVIGFAPEDGTLASLLRALQPTLELDAAGTLPATSHGSTTMGILAVAESIAVAEKSPSGLVIVGDDFGDRLDAPSAEEMANLLRHASAQLLLTTRRSEVVRAFPDETIIRLTNSHGARAQHVLTTADRSARSARRLILDQLLSAMTSRTVVLVEGPLDAEGYGALATRLASLKKKPLKSLPARGMRLVSPPGPEGGITRLKGMAELAVDLGFHVRAIVDGDKPGDNDGPIADLLTVAEQVVALPDRTAIEAALTRGLDPADLRVAAEALESAGAFVIPSGATDDELYEFLVTSRKTIKKQGLHKDWVRALTKQPPIASAALRAVVGDDLGRIDIPDV